MKMLIALAAATLAANMFAETANVAPQQGQKKGPTPEQRERFRRMIGEFVTKPNSQKGKIAFINTQSEIKEEAFSSLAAEQAKHSGFNIVYEKAAAGAPAALKAGSKADIAVIVVADDTTPALLAAVEDGWAVVNVRRVGEGLSTPEAKAKFLESRCQKEVLRAFATIGGGLSSQYPDNLMDITKLADLDLCGVFIPNDAERAMKKVLGARGVTPTFKAHYRQACMQGWAPAPTNDIQKAIWDKVHQLPTKPIQIKFDPKTDKK